MAAQHFGTGKTDGIYDARELMPLTRAATWGLLLLYFALNGCVRRAGRNADCKWPGEPGVKTITQRHLRADVEFAQELAVEYMDAHHGPRSGNFKSQKEASEAMNGCLSTLLAQISETHSIPPKEVAKFLGRRSIVIDSVVSSSFVLVYGLAAGFLIGKIRRRYPPEDGWAAPLMMMILCSLVFAIGGTMLGEQWSTLIENIRVGTGHLSYRVSRLPWVRYERDFFVLYLLLFWAVVGVRLARRQDRSNRQLDIPPPQSPQAH